MKFKKSLGQNFLTDKNILKKIVSLTPLNKKEIIEIGPGTGNLTREILKLSPKNLICIEKDKNLLSILNKNFKYYKNFSASNADILKVNLKNIINKNTIIIEICLIIFQLKY